jgi:hypothetical protein
MGSVVITAYRCLSVAILAAGLASLPARGDTSDNEDLMNFVSGNFVLVGRDLGKSSAYTGTARIEVTGDHLVMHQRVAGRTLEYRGEIRTIAEVQRILFSGEGPADRELSCLVHGDPDNYPRLTCIWERGVSKTPGRGVEALFHQD